MTNFSDTKTVRQSSKQPLIPPATMRAQSRRGAEQSQPLEDNRNSGKNEKRPQFRAPQARNPTLGGEVWSSLEALFWDHMKEVQNKWTTLKLNDDIWAKLIYFEKNRRLAKAYVSAPVLTVDGSTNGLDGFRIGLSGIDNTYRNLDSIACLRSIGQGIKLKIDNHGNILIRKIGGQTNAGQCSVWVKDWPAAKRKAANFRTTSEQNLNSLNEDDSVVIDDNDMEDDAGIMREIERSDISYKLFDMRKFRFQLEKRKLDNENFIDWRQCVSIISFVRNSNINDERQQQRNQRYQHDSNQTNDLLENPCWLMIINIIAIDILKSTVCDNNTKSAISSKLIEPTNSTLIRNHSLLENPLNQSASSRSSFLNRNHQHEPLRTSSSASILFPSSGTNGKAQINSSNNSTTNLAQASSERIKKLRITNANNRFRAPLIKNSSYYLRYQSTQQLSSSSATNSIYTTFNSKYINSKSSAGNSSTSDYNSASHSTSSAYQHNYHHWQQPLYRVDSPSQPRSNGRVSSRAAIRNQQLLDANGKSLSLSTFDLTQRQLDLRSMQSSIKINYNDGYDAENVYGDHFNDESQLTEEQGNPPFQSDGRGAILSSMNNRMNLKKGLNTDTKTLEACNCCELTEELVGGSREQVNHNECQAIQGRGLNEMETNEKRQKQKISQSSIASSSSSSGCVENDYFLSNSSSSMSSSTNERELSSQPASSSGIACSCSTGDESDDCHKLPATATQYKEAHTNSNSSGSALDASNENSAILLTLERNREQNRNVALKSHPHRGHKIKTKLSEYCSNDQHSSQRKEDFNCCKPTEIGCDCCCDCFSSPTLANEVLSSSTSSSSNIHCECESENIYNRLPNPASPQVPVANTNGAVTKTRREGGRGVRGGNGVAQRSDGRISSHSSLKDNSEDISTTPMQQEANADVNADKALRDSQQTSWLERRRYSKILPKFMFASPSPTPTATGNNHQQQQMTDKLIRWNKSTQMKSTNDKFRLTKSTQDLS